MGRVNKLLAEIEAELAPVALNVEQARETAERVYSELIARDVSPKRARRLVVEALARLRGEEVAVRSSKTQVSVYLDDAEAAWLRRVGQDGLHSLIAREMRKPELNPRDKIVAVDFDGVLHQYRQWTGAADIPEPPVPGALEWLREMIRDGRFTVVIFSSRNSQPGGVEAMRDWLRRWGMPEEFVAALLFPVEKPPSHLLIDDRAFAFGGVFPTPDVVAAFRPWWE